ncbi:MFS transporter [Alicyclobacillus curvatus]|jgi:MFS-type transporter involved in bile tolerance (Atg22 family)|nr:MFS transporter [Alicyclobacillus curvatus]
MTLRNNDHFRKLWAGQAVSEVGSRISREAIPMGAVMLLGISPLAMSALSLTTQLPASVLGLFLGVWVDRVARRPLLIGADISRAILLFIIWLAALFHHLQLWMFFAVAALSGILSLLFDVSYEAYLPWLIDRNNLAEGNSKLGMTASLAEVVGPGLAGVLVQALSVPFAIAVDALTYLFSAGSLWRIEKRETKPQASPVTVSSLSGWYAELAEGLKAVMQNRTLLAFAGVTATFGLTSSAVFVLDTLYALRDLGLSPLLFGLTVTVGGIGALLGAAIARHVVRRFGVGKTLMVTLLLQGIAASFWALASGSVLQSTLWLVGAQLLGDTSGMIFGIIETTVRQTIVADELLGRVNSTIRVLDVGFTAVGSLLAGLVANTIGIRTTMAMAACGMMFSVLWLTTAPVRKLRGLPLASNGDDTLSTKL